MMGANFGVVYAQVPTRHGVQVEWRNLQFQGAPNPTEDGYGFCRVGSRRAHPSLGMETDLPAVGELGLIISLDDEVNVWVCSIPWQDINAIIPGLTLKRHDSGVTSQINADGECQLDFPGGSRIRYTINDEPMAIPAGQPNINALGAREVNWMCLDHASGLTLKISPLGDLTISGANTVGLTAVAPISIQGFGTFNLSTLPMTDNPTAAQDWGPLYGLNPQPSLDININAGAAVSDPGAGESTMNVNITAQQNVNVSAPDGTVTISGQNVQIQNGSNGARFCMESLVTWAKNHTHTSAASGSPTSAPTVDPTGQPSNYSPSTLLGQHG